MALPQSLVEPDGNVLLPGESAARVSMPLNAADLAELDLLYRRRGAELGLCGFGFVRDNTAGPRKIRLFMEDSQNPSLTLIKLAGGEFLLSQSREWFPLDAISGLSRMLPWLRANA